MTTKCYICGNKCYPMQFNIVFFAGENRLLCPYCTDHISKRNPAATPQPMPEGQGQEVLEEVIKDLRDRSKEGIRKYGTPLRIDNGRDGLMDLYQELLDSCQYCKQIMMERDKNE